MLSGGVFQNRLLVEVVLDEIAAAGLKGLAHASLPANDGGLALGQAVISLARAFRITSHDMAVVERVSHRIAVTLADSLPVVCRNNGPN